MNVIMTSTSLDESLLPYVIEAKEYYSNDYYSSHGRMRGYYIDSLKYFGSLSKAYHGQSYGDIARGMGFSKSHVRNQILATQNKVKLYIKIKELGRC